MEEKNTLARPEKKVEQLIFRDDLTGIFNRRYLYQYLPQELVRCKNTRQNLWLFMIDVDNFKQVNDRYGHLKGDEALRGVAETLKESVRSVDTVSRYAGDEFTVIVLSAEATVVNTVAARIMSRISSRIFKAEGGLPDFHVNLSIGISNFPDDATDTLRLIDLADKALYASKQKGKNCISYIGDLSADIFASRTILEIFPCPKLIEREKQLNELIGIFDKVNHDKISQMVLISGAAGTGKSRLTEEFLKIAKLKGFASFMDTCSEKYALIPFRSALSTLEKYLKKNQIKKEVLFEGVSTEEQSALGQALPILKKLFTSEGMDGADLKEKRDSLILEGLRKVYINISRQSKICIVIDDFYWADLGSLNLIGALKDQKAQLLICFLLREEEFLNWPSDAMPLVQFKDNLDKFFSGRISVENFSFNGVAEMLSTIFGKLAFNEELTGIIYKITKGNPLFIEELLKFLVQKGFLFYQKGKWAKIELQESDLPHSLEDVILERIKGLEKPAQEIIVKAAVIGQDFSTELLQRMGKEDEGYILDILESAKRIGLIKEKIDPDEDTPSGEGMSFVNEEVRKVVSDLAGEEEVKKLHRQLGEIEESLNVDNLGSVAEELLYHFKKAEDLERSRRYSEMLRDNERSLWGHPLDYPQQALEEREEKFAPLSKKSQKLVNDIIRLLHITLINISLYPKGSEMITSPIEDLYRKFSEIFARDDVVVLSEYKDALVINGEKFKEIDLKNAFAAGILSLFKIHNIESISFRRGLSKNELIIFIENLAVPQEGKSLVEILKSRFVFKIKVRGIDFAVSEKGRQKGKEKIEESMMLDQLLGKGLEGATGQRDILKLLTEHPQEFAKIITQFAETATKDMVGGSFPDKEKVRTEAVASFIQKIKEQISGSNISEVDKYKQSLAAAIMQLDPKLRKKVLLSERLNLPGNDIVKDLSPYFTDEMISDLFTEGFSQKEVSIPRLKNLAMRLLYDNVQRKRLEPILKDKLSKLGITKDDVGWIFGEKKWQDFSLDDKLNKFTEMSVQDYLSIEEELDLTFLLNDIISQNRQDLLVRFLNKWGEFFKIKDAGLRRLLAMNLSNLIDLIPVPKQELLNNFIDFIFAQLQREDYPEIYSIFVSQLARLVDNLVSTQHFLGLKSLLERLEREKSRFSEGLELRSLRAIYDRIFEEKNIEGIIDELLDRIDKNIFYTDLVDVIVLAGEAMIKPLIDEAMVEDKQLAHLGYFGVYLRRRNMGEVLGAIAKNCGCIMNISAILEEKLKSEQRTVVKNAIELIMYIQEPALCNLLSPLIRHPDADVRKKVALVFSRFPKSENLRILDELLKDQDSEVRLNAINLLAKVGDKSDIALLRNLSDPANQEAIRAAVVALENRWGKN